MADVRCEVYIRQDDGTDFSTANEAGAALRLRTSTVAGGDGGEYTGNTAKSGDFAEVGGGLWYINIDSADSGYYRVESSTTAAPAWAAVNGLAPLYIPLADFLPLAGGTMTGSIAMGNNSITGVDDITFHNGAVGEINGIIANNLLDLSVSETVTGDWEFSGALDMTGTPKINGTAITSTAAELNLLDGLTKISDMRTADAQETNAYTDNVTLSYDEAGFVKFSGAAKTITLPALNETNAGAAFLITGTDGTADWTIAANGADGGFVKADGIATAATLTFGASAGECVYIKSPGHSGKYWLILGGFGF